MSENNKKAEAEEKKAEAALPPGADEQIAALKAEVEKYKNEFLYLKADFDNYKKAAIRERSDMLKFGSERVFAELLEVCDNFERALAFEVKPENLQSLYQGFKLINEELKSLLTRFGVTEIPSQGAKFDPNVHNALGTEPTDKIPAGHISQVFKKPYKLHDKVIRPGQVIIAQEPKKEP
jgi:molecular chaperone GrpE